MMRRLWHTMLLRRRGFRIGMTLGVGLWVVAVAVLPIGGVPGAAASTEPFFQTHYDSVPNFAQSPTISSRTSGDWANTNTWNPSRLPTATDVVTIVTGHTVTVRTQTATAKTIGIWAGALLAFDPQQSTRLTVGTLLVMPGGALEVGTQAAPIQPDKTAELIIANQPLHTTNDGQDVFDPQQWGTGLLAVDGTVRMHGAVKNPTFVRLAEEPKSGDTTLRLAEPVTGWRPGDRLVLPDTRQGDFGPGKLFPTHTEAVELASIGPDGKTLHLQPATPVQFDHLGARDGTGALRFRPHVGNLTRNVVLRSEKPDGARGHMVFFHRAEVYIGYVQVEGMGRTTSDELDSTTFAEDGSVTHIGTNQIGRYPVHVHHLVGPAPDGTPRDQFTLMGNAIVNSNKWPMTVHDSHYGRVSENIVYAGTGAGIATEDGSESFNWIERNLVVEIYGDMGRGKFRAGTEGSAFWFAGPNNYIQDNVAASSIKSGFDLYGGENSSQPIAGIPSSRGADPFTDGVEMNLAATPVLRFERNEAYAVLHGIETWYLGYKNYYEPVDGPMEETLVKDFTAWHTFRFVFFGNQQHHLSVDGLVAIGDPNKLGYYDYPVGLDFHQSKDVVVRNTEVQQFKVGLSTPGPLNGLDPDHVMTLNDINPTLIENSQFSNVVDILNAMFEIDAFGVILPRKTVIRNVRFGPGSAIVMAYADDRFKNVIQTDQVWVYSYNGDAKDNFRVYYPEQASDFVVPQTGSHSDVGPDSPLGSPEAGLTNAQNWAKYGIAIAGAITPCITEREGISGFVCAASPPPPTATLTIVKAGPGSGTVTSADGFITCGATCTHTYPTNTSVSLTASPAGGSTFGGWSGPGCNDTVVMSSNRTCTATFNSGPPPTATLTILKAGIGGGTVTSADGGINCGPTCSKTYDLNTVVTLTATPATGSSFGGWGGAGCGDGPAVQGAGLPGLTITVTMTGDRTCTATFNSIAPGTATLTVSKAGTGNGTVTSADSGINCGVSCAHTYNLNDTVSLNALPAAGSTFGGWSGAGCGPTVVMTSDRTCSALFLPADHTDQMTLKDFDGPTVPLNNAGDEYPRYLYGEYQGVLQGGIFDSTINTSDAISGSSLAMHLTEGLGLYAQFNAHNADGTRGFAREYAADPEAWQFNTYNRMRFWMKVPVISTSHQTNGRWNFNVGTYGKSVGTPDWYNDATGGGHFYHHINTPALGQWVQVILNMHPNHRLGDEGWMEPGNLPHPTGEDAYNYFDAMTRFYIAEFDSDPVVVPRTYLLDQMEFYREPYEENDEQVYSITAVYEPPTNRLIVTWNRNKNENDIAHEVRFAFANIHAIGWDAATPAPDRVVLPPGWQGYNAMVYDTTSLPLAGRPKVYIAIRPVGATLFSQIAVPLAGVTSGAPVLTITKAGTGSGTVTSADGGITCGTTCAHIYNLNDAVTLTATPASPSTFGGWSGAGCGDGPAVQGAALPGPVITVVMAGDRACTATFLQSVGNEPPTAEVAAAPASGTAPLPVAFNGSGSFDPDGTIVAYAWTFGDGVTGAGATVNHTYTTAGTFTATLTVTDNQGASGSASVTIVVTQASGGGPTITQEPADRTVRVGGQATFSVAATGTGRLHYQWQRDGVDIPGATSRHYTTPPATLADNGATFQVVVSDRTGSVTSRAATLTVAPRRQATAPR